MKNITRRGFLQLTAATALVCAAAPLTGCRKKNIKKLVLGDWYMEGYSRLEYAIYDWKLSGSEWVWPRKMVDCK